MVKSPNGAAAEPRARRHARVPEGSAAPAAVGPRFAARLRLPAAAAPLSRREAAAQRSRSAAGGANPLKRVVSQRAGPTAQTLALFKSPGMK